MNDEIVPIPVLRAIKKAINLNLLDCNVWLAVPCPCVICNQSGAETTYFIWHNPTDKGGLFCIKHGLIGEMK